ncbi:MAG: hypothetical protein U5Q03_02415 [Bacteroidota bacterium]|nr:hypothetical protein [Bacteroidota bacterium]
MAKTICKTKDKTKLEKKSADPEFYCKKCKAEVKKEKHVCKPKKL